MYYYDSIVVQWHIHTFSVSPRASRTVTQAVITIVTLHVTMTVTVTVTVSAVIILWRVVTKFSCQSLLC